MGKEAIISSTPSTSRRDLHSCRPTTSYESHQKSKSIDTEDIDESQTKNSNSVSRESPQHRAGFETDVNDSEIDYFREGKKANTIAKRKTKTKAEKSMMMKKRTGNNLIDELVGILSLPEKNPPKPSKHPSFVDEEDSSAIPSDDDISGLSHSGFHHRHHHASNHHNSEHYESSSSLRQRSVRRRQDKKSSKDWNKHRNHQLLDLNSDDSEWDDLSDNTEMFVKGISNEHHTKWRKRSSEVGHDLVEEVHLGNDTFTFFITAEVGSLPFATGVFVLGLKTAAFILIAADIIDLNNKKNPFNIPASVSNEVLISQFFAVFITVITQDDLISSFNLAFEGYSTDLALKFAGSSYSKWMLAVCSLWLEGLLGVGTTLLLIITSDEVLALLLNFTAIEFVSYLDNISFELSKGGYFGPANKKQALLIENTTYQVRFQARSHRERSRFNTLFVFLLLLVVAWASVFLLQANGRFQAKSFTVQFNDQLNKALGAYSGLYVLQMQNHRMPGFDRIRYTSSRNDAFFGYCQKLQTWTFSTAEVGGIDDPCQGILAQSAVTPTFDIIETSKLGWYAVLDNFSTKAFEMEEFHLHIGCSNDNDCGGVGRGYCGDEDHCICEDSFYGLWCDYSDSTTCERIEVQTEGVRFVASREYATVYTLLRRTDNNKVLEVYNRPLYLGKLEDSNAVDVILYDGLQWVMMHANNGLVGLDNSTEEGVLAYFMKHPHFDAISQIAKVEFISDSVHFNSPGDALYAAPLHLKWTKTRNKESLQDLEKLSEIPSSLICSRCHPISNPCQNNNSCVEGSCICENGATGKLCDVLPISDGKCDISFNVPAFNYDGGDCCQSTCVSTLEHRCGVRVDGELDYVDVGFHDCVDPNALCANGKGCWSEKSRHIRTLSKTNAAYVTLSSNGNTVAITEPELDLIHVYDQVDSIWTQRGELIEGELESDFGRVTAINTLPGEVVSRRFGVLPIVLAATFNRGPARNVKVYEWGPTSVSWESPGTIKICDNECEIIMMSIARDDQRYRLVVELRNKTSILYQSHFDETGSKIWSKVHQVNQSSKGFISFAGDGHTLVVSDGTDIIVYNVSDTHVAPSEFYSLVNSPDPMFSAIQEADIKTLKLSYDGKRISITMVATEDFEIYSIYLASFEVCHSCGAQRGGLGELVPIKKTLLQLDSHRELVDSIFSEDGETVIVKLHNRDSSIYTLDIFTAGFHIGKDGETYASTVTKTDDVSEESHDHHENKRDLFANSEQIYHQRQIYHKSVERSVELSTTTVQKRGFVRVGQSIQVTVGSHFAISEQGPTVLFSEVDTVRSLKPASACGPDEVDIRLSMSHEVHPDRVSWELETLIEFNGEFFVKRVNEECDHCYTPNHKFGRTKVTEVICKPAKDRDCIRFLYHHDDEHSVGEGFVLFLNGTELGRLNPSQDTNEMEIIQPSLYTNEDCSEETLVCEEGFSEFAMVILVDDDPQEVSWNIYDSQGNFSYDFPIGNFSVISEFRIKQMCLPKDGCYVLTIKDEGHSGICCDRGLGYYTLFFEGQEIVPERRGDFGYRRSHVFGSTCMVDLGCIELPGSERLPEAPALTNYQLQDCAVRPILCDNDNQILFGIGITFDNYPGDLFWIVRDYETFAELAHSQEYGNLPPESTGYFQSCIQKTRCYLLQLYDESGNGICCSDGGGGLSYKFGYENKSVNVMGNFGPGALISVGEACPELVTIGIEIALDNHPEQIHWAIYDPVHFVYLYSVAPYFYGKDKKEQKVMVQIQLLPNSRYIFRLFDKFGDGIKNGSYKILLKKRQQDGQDMITEEESFSLLTKGTAYFAFTQAPDVHFDTTLIPNN